ncbi:hypothetical protein TWF718_005819 [Orbilia javanica]|uniref:Peptidase S8/S53 domain-containing protein n=1 Tax=Orbilia javanica TaxID=47235 RepID=A0AAN8N456_9PEZI
MEFRNIKLAEPREYFEAYQELKNVNGTNYQDQPTIIDLQKATPNPKYQPLHRRQRKSRSTAKVQAWKDVPENCILSQHDGYPLTDPCVYYTPRGQGVGVTVYIVDYAFAIHHKDFKHISWGSSKDHIFADDKDKLPSSFQFRNKRFLPNDVDEETLLLLRGTGVLSRLLGKKFGVARGVKPILVKTSDRFSSLQPENDHIFNAFTKVLLDIKKKSAKIDVSSRKAPKFIVLMATDYRFERLPGRPFQPYVKRLGQLIQEVSEMPNVAVVTSDDNQYSMAKAPAPGEYSQLRPINSYPALFGRERETFPNLVVVGGTHPGDGGLMSPYEDFIRVSAPSVNITVAVPDGGKSWGGKRYSRANSNPLAAAAITGVLATLISAKEYTISEAIERLYDLAYPRRRESAAKGDSRVFPKVVYNGFSLLIEEPQGVGGGAPAPATVTVTVTVYQGCQIMRREVTRESLGKGIGMATRTITLCEREAEGMPETTYVAASSVTIPITIPTTTPSHPELEYTDKYDAAFCEQCLSSNGEVPISGILWIPKDCPCRDGGRRL